MKTCPRCNKSYPDSEKFCAIDGSALDAGASAVGGGSEQGVDCPSCGGRAQPGETICNFCGARLKPEGDFVMGARQTSELERRPSPQAPQPTRLVQPQSEMPAPAEQPDEPEGRSFGARLLRAIAYTAAGLLALAGGAWLALHLSAKQAQKIVAQPSPIASPAAAIGPYVALAITVPTQVTGESAAAPERNQDAARRMFEANKTALLESYKRTLASNSALRDAMLVTIRVAPDGTVNAGSVKTSTTPDPGLDAEVVGTLMALRFGSFSGGSVEIDYPIVFSTDPADQARLEGDLGMRANRWTASDSPEYANVPAATPAAAAASAAAPTTEVPAAAALATAAPILPPATASRPARRRVETAARSTPQPSMLATVQDRLRSDRRLRRVKAYTDHGTVTLFGKVFDDNDKMLAERTARSVDGVTNVVDTLTTDTGQWAEEESRITQNLQNVNLGKVTVKVIGDDAYLDGEVSTDAEKDQAVTITESAAAVKVRTNLIRVVPKSFFGF
jgi:hypothetical protein